MSIEYLSDDVLDISSKSRPTLYVKTPLDTALLYKSFKLRICSVAPACTCGFIPKVLILSLLLKYCLLSSYPPLKNSVLASIIAV